MCARQVCMTCNMQHTCGVYDVQHATHVCRAPQALTRATCVPWAGDSNSGTPRSMRIWLPISILHSSHSLLSQALARLPCLFSHLSNLKSQGACLMSTCHVGHVSCQLPHVPCQVSQSLRTLKHPTSLSKPLRHPTCDT